MGLQKCTKLIVAAFAIVAVAHASARAQSAGAQAESLFRQGKDLMAQGKIAEACAAFDASEKYEHAITTQLNQASCREKNGQLTTAWGLFVEAERQSRGATDASSVQLHQVAADHASKLEQRLSTLTITVPAENRVGGLEILRKREVADGGDNETVDPGAWNKALPVDGGTYKITARAPGNAEWTSTITVNTEHDAKTIEIPKLKAAALTSQTTQSTGTTPLTTEPAAAPARTKSKVVPIVVGVGALALGGTAIALELSASSTYNKSLAATNDADRTSLWHSANTKRYAAEGIGAAGVAAVGVAIWLYVRSGGKEAAATETSQLILAPVVGSDRAGLVLRGSY